MKIVADSKIPFLKGLLEPVAQEVLYVPGSDITNEVLRDAQVLLTRTRTRCDRRLLQGTAVKFIGTATIGTDHIDLDYCSHNSITVVNAPGCNAPAVAQWVHSTILQWLAAQPAPLDHPLTLGIVGVGHVGSIVARWAHQLGYRVLLNDPPLEEQATDTNSELLTLNSKLIDIYTLHRKCDIITFHTPLTRDGDYPTWHLCDEAFLNSLQRCRLIINAARGAVCDNEALLRWQGDIALDCWEGEPNINRELLEKAFVATPHIAGYSLQGKQRGTSMIIKALNRHFGWNITPVQASTPLKGAENVTPQTIIDSYNPLIDTAHLKSAPTTFESLRNNYPLRNELEN
jgi:erythronate-4-phosphate dehydrogenase